MSDAEFLNKLYLIKPFKMVQSPQSNKFTPQKQMENCSIPFELSHNIDQLQKPQTKQKVEFKQIKYVQTPKKSNISEPIIETQIFSNLTSSIDHLFSKIQKIKSQFEHQPSSKKKGIDKENSGNKKINKPKDKQNQFNLKPFQLNLSSTPVVNQKTMSSPEKLFKMDFKIQQPQLNYKINKQFVPLFSSFPQDPEKQQFLKSQIIKEPLCMRDFELGKCVGSGKFGDVHICRHRKTGTLFALKKIFKSTLLEYEMVDQFTKQLKIHYKLDHPNIVKLYTHFDDEYHIFLLMEYAEGGMLMNHLKKEQKFVSQTIQQIINAVQYLHKNQIAHRDIKPQNIVIFADENMKLCDFGWSSMFENEMKKTFCGTLDYVSPEMKDKGQYTVSVDLWSIGVLTFQLITGFPPYKKQIDKWKLKGGKMHDKWKWDFQFPAQVSQTAQDFISKILKENPNERASLRQCKKHPFIQQYKVNNENQILFPQII